MEQERHARYGRQRFQAIHFGGERGRQRRGGNPREAGDDGEYQQAGHHRNLRDQQGRHQDDVAGAPAEIHRRQPVLASPDTVGNPAGSRGAHGVQAGHQAENQRRRLRVDAFLHGHGHEMHRQHEGGGATDEVREAHLPDGEGLKRLPPVFGEQRLRRRRGDAGGAGGSGRRFGVAVGRQALLGRVVVQEHKGQRNAQHQDHQTQHDPGQAPVDEADQVSGKGHQDQAAQGHAGCVEADDQPAPAAEPLAQHRAGVSERRSTLSNRGHHAEHRDEKPDAAGGRHQQCGRSHDDNAGDDHDADAHPVEQVAHERLGHAVEQRAQGGGPGHHGAVPLELGLHGHHERAEGVARPHGEERDKHAGGNNEPPVKHAGTRRIAGRHSVYPPCPEPRLNPE